MVMVVVEEEKVEATLIIEAVVEAKDMEETLMVVEEETLSRQ
jgi:hypothetical protein